MAKPIQYCKVKKIIINKKNFLRKKIDTEEKKIINGKKKAREP